MHEFFECNDLVHDDASHCMKIWQALYGPHTGEVETDMDTVYVAPDLLLYKMYVCTMYKVM